MEVKEPVSESIATCALRSGAQNENSAFQRIPALSIICLVEFTLARVLLGFLCIAQWGKIHVFR